jgi:hypothetical protein
MCGTEIEDYFTPIRGSVYVDLYTYTWIYMVLDIGLDGLYKFRGRGLYWSKPLSIVPKYFFYGAICFVSLDVYFLEDNL